MSGAYAVMKRQPSAAADSKLAPSGSGTQLRSATGTRTRSANEPQLVNPGWRSSSHTCVCPSRHGSQRPQPQQNGAVTRSPTRIPRTSGPTAATTPANSWPGTWGRRIESSCPLQPCQSLRHRPVARTSTTAPSGPGSGSGTSSIRSGSLKACMTTARTQLSCRS